MKRARIAHQGRELWAGVSADGQTLMLPGGGVLAAADAHWLAPIMPGAAVYALGLNYADHSRELGFAARQATPLVFLKGGNCFTGHRGSTVRPAGAN